MVVVVKMGREGLLAIMKSKRLPCRILLACLKNYTSKMGQKVVQLKVY